MFLYLMMQIKIPVDIDVDWFGEPENVLVILDTLEKLVMNAQKVSTKSNPNAWLVIAIRQILLKATQVVLMANAIVLPDTEVKLAIVN